MLAWCARHQLLLSCSAPFARARCTGPLKSQVSVLCLGTGRYAFLYPPRASFVLFSTWSELCSVVVEAIWDAHVSCADS